MSAKAEELTPKLFREMSILQMTAKAGCELTSRKAKKTPLVTILQGKKNYMEALLAHD